MPEVFDEDIKLKLEEIDSIIAKKYKLEHPMKERDWKTRRSFWRYTTCTFLF